MKTHRCGHRLQATCAGGRGGGSARRRRSFVLVPPAAAAPQRPPCPVALHPPTHNAERFSFQVRLPTAGQQPVVFGAIKRGDTAAGLAAGAEGDGRVQLVAACQIKMWTIMPPWRLRDADGRSFRCCPCAVLQALRRATSSGKPRMRRCWSFQRCGGLHNEPGSAVDSRRCSRSRDTQLLQLSAGLLPASRCTPPPCLCPSPACRPAGQRGAGAEAAGADAGD